MIRKIILFVIGVSGFVGIIAFLKEIYIKSDSHKFCGVYERYVKRPLDACLATGALIMLSPVLLVTALFVRVKLGSPVLFTQERPGKDEKFFKLYKFRTMRDAKDSQGKDLPDAERLTSFGKKLRATSLDELPELFNIIKGEMAIIGPRPLLIRYLPFFYDDERIRHQVRPGLTGLAQINGRNNLNWNERLAYDSWYARRITFAGDVHILIETVVKVFKHADITEDGHYMLMDLDEERKQYADN